MFCSLGVNETPGEMLSTLTEGPSSRGECLPQVALPEEENNRTGGEPCVMPSDDQESHEGNWGPAYHLPLGTVSQKHFNIQL